MHRIVLWCMKPCLRERKGQTRFRVTRQLLMARIAAFPEFQSHEIIFPCVMFVLQLVKPKEGWTMVTRLSFWVTPPRKGEI